MANRKQHRTWSFITGEKGRNRVRAYERGARGIFLDVRYRDAVTGAPMRERVSLGHVDRETAKAKAEEFASRLRMGEHTRAPELTVGALFDSYEAHVSPTKGDHSQRHDRRALEMMGRYFGRQRPVSRLDRRDWDGFIRDRRSGKIRSANVTRPRAIRNRSIEQDLRLLLAVFNWASVVRRQDGTRLVSDNPFAGFPMPREENANRPVLTHDEFEAMLAAAPAVNPTMTTLLTVANGTGHRINSIRTLHWSDVDFDAGEIRWRAEFDKIGHEHRTPIMGDVREALLAERRRTLWIGSDGWVFPSPLKPEEPMSRHLVRDWWERTQAAAGLAKVRGRGWHSLRRKFATELKGTNLKDLCALGGWKDHNTILKCYQQPDPDTMRVALEQRGTLRAVRRG